MFKRPLRELVYKILSAVICVSMLLISEPVLAASASSSEPIRNLDTIQPPVQDTLLAQPINAPYKINLTASPQPRAAFSTAKPMNVAQWEDGASIVDYSSVANDTASVRPENAIDFSTSTSWIAGSEQVTDQWIKVKLAGDLPSVIDHVVIGGNSSPNGPKGFEILVSKSGYEDADFTSVFTETVPQTQELHSFSFDPVSATYVQLLVRNNWGHSHQLAVRHFQAWTRDREGGIVSLLDGPPSIIVDVSSEYGVGNKADKAIDSYETSAWRSASGSNSNQWITVQLGSGQIYTIDRVRLMSGHVEEAPQDFEVRVSTTTLEEAAFNPVFNGTAAETTDIQEFLLDETVQAKYVQLIIFDNYGSSCCVRVNTFQVLTPDGVNVARLDGVGAFILDYSSDFGSSYTAENAIDFKTNTRWLSARNQNTDQWFKVRLMEGAPYLIDKISFMEPISSDSPKNFEVRVSNDSLEDVDFKTILTATLPKDGISHWYAFAPVEAKYVQLFIHDNYGGSTIGVYDFKVYSPQLGDATVPFDDFSEKPFGSIIDWSWDFGDGSSSMERHPIHTYASPGTYPVSLTVTDDEGLIDTASMDYTVFHSPIVDFTWEPTTPNEGQTTSVEGEASDFDGFIIDWQWQFSHTTIEYHAQKTAVLFPDNGDFEVTLTVTDHQLLTSSVTKTVTMLNVPPSVNISDQTVLLEDELFVRPDVYEPGSTDRSTLTYLWDLGDGNVFGQKDLLHFYEVDGQYEASLTVTDKDEGVGMDTAIFTVEKRPTTTIYIGAQSGEAGEPATLRAKLRDTTTGDAIAGQRIYFDLAGQSASAFTNERGIAETTLIFSGDPGIYSVSATFAEDDTYLGSSDVETLAVDGLFPDSITVTLEPGQSVIENKSAVIPKAFGLADIILAFDTTGSMRGVIREAQDQGIEIVEDLSGLIENGRFAVISHGDYPNYYESFGYHRWYAVSTDFPYHLELPLTSDVDHVIDALDNIRHASGIDPPESYTRVMYESVAELIGDPNPTEGILGYRDESKRILIHFNDTYPHDNNLNEGVPGESGVWSSGGDPGRNQIMDETEDPTKIGLPYNDDLNLQTVLSLMAENNVTLIAVRTNTTYMQHWEHWAGLTGGDMVLMSSGPASVSDTVREAIEAEAGELERVTLEVSPGYEHWVSFLPSEYLNVTTPVELEFEVTITVPLDAPAGEHAFTITLVGDGFAYSHQTVNITVPVATDTPTPTPTDTSTPTPTATYTHTPTNTSTPTPSATFTPSPTNTPTWTPTPTHTSTPTPTNTMTPSVTPTSTVTPTPTPNTGVEPPAFPLCPDDMEFIGTYDDAIRRDHEPSSYSYPIDLALTGDVQLLGWVMEGHPERGCPGDPSCDQNQDHEDIVFDIDGDVLGVYEDSEHGPHENAWYFFGPMKTELAAGSHSLTFRHTFHGEGAQSAYYRFSLCAPVVPTPTWTHTPSPTASQTFTPSPTPTPTPTKYWRMYIPIFFGSN